MEETLNKKKHLVIDSFWLKVVALITMTVDHVGLALENVLPSAGILIVSGGWLDNLILVLRMIGRLSFPLFVFLLAEGLRHTHSRERYLLRLSAVWIAVLAVSCVIQFGFSTNVGSQAFSDLLPYALFIYLLESKNRKIRTLALLPLAYVGASYFIRFMSGVDIAYAPFRLFFGGYNIYGFALFMLFYYSPKLLEMLVSSVSAIRGEEMMDEYRKTEDYRFLLDLFCAGSIIVVNLVFWGLCSIGATELFASGPYDIWSMGLQSYSCLSAVLVACYSGRLGYNGKWFKYGCYAYYPIHLGLIFLIVALCVGAA